MPEATQTPIAPVQTTPGTAQGSLAGTMQGATGPVLAPPPVPSQNTGKSNQFGLAQVMSALEAKTTSNNALMTQRNLLLKHLYDQPLTPEEQKNLDPTFLKSIQGNDRNQIDLSLRLISDEIAGRTNSLDKSVQFLTTAYNEQVQQAESSKQEAINKLKVSS